MLAARLFRIGVAAFGLLVFALYERIRRVTAERSRLPERLCRTLERLGPAFIKVGQALSLRRDMLPDRYLTGLSKLHAGAHVFSSSVARQEIERSLGRPIAGLFASFDDMPIAAGSIAQVHGARLSDGRSVIVKVRRPDVRAQIDRDMRALVRLLRLAVTVRPSLERFAPVRVAQEIWSNLRRETDFRLEARAIRRFGNAFRDWPSVHVPAAIDGMVTESVLAQEFSEGRLLADPALAGDGPLYATNLVDIYLHQIFVLGFFHGDPHPGNLFFMPAGTICFHDFGMIGQLDRATRQRLALFVQAFVYGDPDWMLDAAIDLGLLNVGDDRERIARGMEEILAEYALLPMREWSIAELFLRVSQLGQGGAALLPSHLVVLTRALFELEHALHTLDPAMNLLDTLVDKGNAVISALIEKPSRAGMARLGFEAGLAVHELPGIAASWLTEARRGGFHPAVRIHVPEIEPTEAGIERMGNRLALALVTLGLYIASSLLMQHSIGPRVFGMPVLALFGYLLALWYTLRLARGIARSGRL